MAKKRTTEWVGVPHVRVRLDVLDSPAWRVLSYSAKALYMDLRAKVRSTNNGNVNATLSEMKHRGWRSPVTLSKALQELEALGFLAKTRQGGIASMSKVCSLYRFTDLNVPEFPKLGIGPIAATFEFQRFTTVKEAKAAVREEKPKLQKMKLQATETEAMRPPIATETEQVGQSKLQKLNKGGKPEMRAISGGKEG